MKYPWAIPGAQVICIKSTPWRDRGGRGPDNPPKFMQQYTILEVRPNRDGFVGLKLKETPEGFYYVAFFRPLEKLEQENEQKAKEPVQ